MAGELKVVDLERDIVHFGGFKCEGWASGDAMTIAIPPDYTYTAGGDGLGIRSRTGDRSVVVKLRLSRGSSVNDLLSAVRSSGLKTPNGQDVVSFSYEDTQGTTTVAGQAWIEQAPEIQIGETPGPREWTLRVHNPDVNIGGN